MSIVNVTHDFISEQDLAFYIELINEFEREKLEHFSIWQEGTRIALPFGNAENEYKTTTVSQPSLDLFTESQVGRIRYLFSTILEELKLTYDVEDDLYICSFWLAKQYPGGSILEHEDTDGGVNLHFEHSVVLYLNTLKSGGDLVFPSLDVSQETRAGDLVSFPTKGTGSHLVHKFLEERYSLAFWTTKDKSYQL